MELMVMLPMVVTLVPILVEVVEAAVLQLLDKLVMVAQEL